MRTTDNNYITETKKEKKVKVDFFLNGKETLTQTHITEIYTVKREKDLRCNIYTGSVLKELKSRNVEHLMTFPLSEVDLDKLAELRASDKPGLVLKVDGKYYYAEIDKKIRISSENILGEHKCADINKQCKRLSAAPDKLGGCAKVRGGSRNIEKYEWITEGYETFNTLQDTFVVVKCLHHKP